CSTVWGYVPQCGDMFHSVGICSTVWGYVPQCGDMFHSVGICSTVWGYRLESFSCRKQRCTSSLQILSYMYSNSLDRTFAIIQKYDRSDNALISMSNSKSSVTY
ncbi:hypothetical protein OTU49_002750, partial [Cherax quadricarinatus]